MLTLTGILFSGLSLGAIYCVFALGLSLVYGTSRVLNFAYGSVYMTAAYAAWLLSNGWLGLNALGVFGLLMPLAFGFGLLFERFLIRPLRSRPQWKTATMMTTLGFAFVLDNFNLVVFGPTAKTMSPLVAGAVEIWGVTVANQTLATLGLAFAAVVALQAFLTYAPLGQAMRAVSQDMDGAAIVGIRVNRVFALSFGLSAMLAAFAALLLSPVYLVSPLGGWSPFLKAFVIVVFGGLGSTPGVLWAAFILGFVEAAVIAVFGATWTLPVWFMVLLVVLLFRPRGLMGKWGTETMLQDRTRISAPVLAGLTVVALALLGPLLANDYFMHIMILCFIWTIVIAAWDLTIGYAGIFNFAQLALFAVGGYSSAMLSIHLGLPPLLAVIVASGITGLAGFIIALPCLRLKGEYVALFTFSVHLALPTLLEKGRGFGTGGATGLMGIPPIELFGLSFTTANKLGWYFLALACAVAAVWVIYVQIVRSRAGRSFVALRDAEDFARSLGVDDMRAKLLLFTVSAAITGFGGALYTHYIGVITPRVLGNEFFLLAMVMLSIGGMARFPGAILGVFVVMIGNELLRELGQYRLLILGIVVVFVVIWLPNGLGGRLMRSVQKRARIS